MIVIITILIALGLLGLTVYGLHKYQTIEVELNADRSMPLPPLGKEFRGTMGIADAGGGFEDQSESSFKIKQAVVDASSARRIANPPNPSWQDELAELKKAGDILGALALCEHEFPLWGAFNQACIVLRGQLKSPELTETQTDDLLTQLYRTAAIAELIHDKSPEYQHLTLNQLKALELRSAEALDMPYANLGYAHLRLIRKSDIRLMQARWGRPLLHSTPRKLHRQWWQQITSQAG